jgi:O-antigen ligase
MLILGLLIFISILYNNGKLDRFINGYKEIQSLEENNFNGSWGHRAYMWYAAKDIFTKEPIFGTGVGDNIDEFIEYTKTNPSRATWLRTFHNQHLDILTKLGLVGFLLLWGSVIILILQLKNGDQFYFAFALIFFLVIFYDGFGDIILLMKPFNNIFVLIFVLLSVVVYQQQNMKLEKGDT